MLRRNRKVGWHVLQCRRGSPGRPGGQGCERQTQASYQDASKDADGEEHK